MAYKDKQIVAFRRKYPLQVTKMLPDIEDNMDYLEQELAIFKSKGIRAAIFQVRHDKWQEPRIVLMREVYDDDIHKEPYALGYREYKLKKYISKKGKLVLADRFCWAGRFKKPIYSV